jgi:hypothetical protein
MRGMENAKFVISVRGGHWNYLVLGAKRPRYATGCDNLQILSVNGSFVSFPSSENGAQVTRTS